MQAVGVEVATHNVQVNLIAQNYVENPEYFPPELTERESFVRPLKRQVPAGRLATARENVLLAVFLVERGEQLLRRPGHSVLRRLGAMNSAAAVVR